jgi:hypothetical protein
MLDVVLDVLCVLTRPTNTRQWSAWVVGCREMMLELQDVSKAFDNLIRIMRTMVGLNRSRLTKAAYNFVVKESGGVRMRCWFSQGESRPIW